MSYLHQAHDPRRRATAIVTAGAFNALLAAGLVTGLAVDFTEVLKPRIEATNIPLDPPKPQPTPVSGGGEDRGWSLRYFLSFLLIFSGSG